MGYQTAIGIAESSISLEQQLAWHFTSNCYPPVPSLMIPFAIEAIEYANEGSWGEYIPCPEGVSYRGKDEVEVDAIIEGLHLQAFLTYQGEDE